MTETLEPTYQLSNHVVCAIDILGQKDNLKSWSVMPTDGTLSPTFVAGMKRSIGVVDAFNRGFKQYFETQQKQSEGLYHELALAQLTTTEKERYRLLHDVHLGVEQFSDTFIFYAPLANPLGELMVLPIYAILGACCMAMLFSLAGKVAIRGAVHIAPGLKLPRLSFYGPALVEAHRLESEIAQYPRVVVTSEVVNFLHQEPRGSAYPRIDDWVRAMLRLCQSLLWRDPSDGQVIVDWLGKGWRQIEGATVDPKTTVAIQAAHQFVSEATVGFRDRATSSASTGDTKLALRYGLLYQYIVSRLPIWGLSAVIKSGSDKGVGDGR